MRGSIGGVRQVQVVHLATLQSEECNLHGREDHVDRVGGGSRGLRGRHRKERTGAKSRKRGGRKRREDEDKERKKTSSPTDGWE